MKILYLMCLLTFFSIQVSFAEDKKSYQEIVSLNKESIIELAKEIIRKKKPEINHDDLKFKSINYHYDPSKKYGSSESLLATFVLTKQVIVKGQEITYETIHVTIDPTRDISKSNISFGTITDFGSYGYPLSWYLLGKYNTIIYPLSSILWVYLIIVIYKRFHEKFMILFIIGSAIGILYVVLGWFAQGPGQFSLKIYSSIIYALGGTIEVMAIILCLKFLKKIKTQDSSPAGVV